MKFQKNSFSKNYLDLIKILPIFFLISLTSSKVVSEIPDKYKITSSLTACTGNDYKKWDNCYGEFKFPRITYKGEWKDGNFHGKGILREAWGDIYIGDFKNNLAEGYGKQYSYVNGKESGGWFEGEVKNDSLNGKGIYVYDNGTKEEGNFKDGELNGKGIVVYASGNKKEGNFEKGELNGNGIINWDNGDKYIGDWVEGYRVGKGKYFFASGTVYEGDFLKSDFEGKGTISYDNGTKYIGEFSKGYEHGQGKIFYKNGDIYTGYFKNGYENGQGKMVYASGEIYEGLWSNGDPLKGKTTLAKFTTTEKYYALILGNNEYQKLEKLDNAVTDAKDLAKILQEKYGFETTLLLNQTAGETVDALIEFTQNRKSTDNILIYYAGHGQLNRIQKRGYWLPIDASEQLDSKWISNNNIKDYIASSKAKHILLVVDSCFAGSLMRGSEEIRSIEKLTENTLKRLQKLKTRLVITSGGNEYVADGIGGSKNSVFAEPLIKALNNNNDVIRSGELFAQVRSYVVNNADQTPNQSLIHGTGHDGGEFLFFPKK